MQNKSESDYVHQHTASEIVQCHLRWNGKHQSGQNEMDKFVIRNRNKFLEKYEANHYILKFRWQKSFYDHVIRNKKNFENHWNYSMYNFRKHRLSADWQYTGLNHPDVIDEIYE